MTAFMDRLAPFAWISLGAVAGANLRYGVSRLLERAWGVGFPWGTFVANIVGSFVIGLLGTLLAERFLPHAEFVRFALIVGFLGSLTTFSSFTWETTGLLNDAAWLRATLNITLSVFLGLGAVRLGELAARSLVARG